MYRRYAVFAAVSTLLAISASLHSAGAFFQAQSMGAVSGHVYCLVHDKNGDGLPPPKERIGLQIDGQQAEIEDIRSLKTSPLFFSVLMDISGSSREYARQEDTARSQLFQALSGDQALGYLLLFGPGTYANEQPVGVPVLEDGLRRFREPTRLGPTALYDAVVHAATAELAPKRIPEDSRRAIFILSDGGDTYSQKTLRDTVEILQRDSIPVFSIGFRQPSDRESARELGNLSTLSDATGGSGTVLEESSDSANTVPQLAKLASSQCLITFKLPALKQKKSYPVQLESSDKDIELAAQKAYFVQ